MTTDDGPNIGGMVEQVLKGESWVSGSGSNIDPETLL